MDTTHTPHHDHLEEPPVQQLSLLPTPEVPLRFRIDAATRRRGLQHVSEIRQMLAERQAAREAEVAVPFGTASRRTDRAA